MESSDELQGERDQHLQLSKAIKNYKSVLDQCKKSTSLSNYHKTYIRNLNKRCDQLKEAQLSKVQLLIPPGMGTDHNFSIYKFLSSKPQIKNLKIPIIDTLFMSNLHCSFMSNTQEGGIQLTHSEDSLQQFIKRLNYNSTTRVPICVLKPENSKLLLFDSVPNFTSFLSQNPDFQGIAQKFVFNFSEHLSIVRVHWARSGKTKAFLIGNKDTVFGGTEAMSKTPVKSQPVSKALISTEASDEEPLKQNQTDEECLNYAYKAIKKHKRAQLRRFSILSRHISQIEVTQGELFSIHENDSSHVNKDISSFLEQLNIKCKESNINLWNEEETADFLSLSEKEAERFLVSGTNSERLYVTELKNLYPGIMSTLLKTVDLVNHHLTKHKKILKELTLDFVKDTHKWVLLKADDIMLDESTSGFHEIPLPSNKITFSSFIPPLGSKYGNKIDLICMKIRNLPSKRADPPLLHTRTMSQSLQFLPIHCPNIKEKPAGSLIKVKEKLDQLVKRTENFTDQKTLNIGIHRQKMIQSYSESFQICSTALKSIESKKSVHTSEGNSFAGAKKEVTKSMDYGINIKPIIKEYNSMMIHVRRVHLKNKKPLIEHYGGEDFFRSLIKTFCQKIVPIDSVNKRISVMSKESFNSMFLKGLGCIFNSNISLEFRQQVRQKHKNLGIDSETFKSFCSIFSAVLQECKVLDKHIEVISDNLASFSSSICCQSRKTKS